MQRASWFREIKYGFFVMIEAMNITFWRLSESHIRQQEVHNAELTTDLIVQEQTYKARTYGLSETKIEGFVDELAALKQAIYKILSTEQYEYPIYSF